MCCVVCVVGCGLGMVSILLDKMKVCSSILATDGDDSTMDLLRENIRLTGTVQYGTLQYDTVQCGMVQCSTVLYSPVQYSTVQYR